MRIGLRSCLHSAVATVFLGCASPARGQPTLSWIGQLPGGTSSFLRGVTSDGTPTQQDENKSESITAVRRLPMSTSEQSRDFGSKTNGNMCEPVWTPNHFISTRSVSSVVNVLAALDDGSGNGPELYAGGEFVFAGGLTVNRIAKWNGSRWLRFGTGIDSSYGRVGAITLFDEGTGSGPDLYVGGTFSSAGGVSANHIAKWNGTSWSALGTGMSAGVSALTVFDDGSGGGPALYAGGSFTTAGGVVVNRIAKWNGSSWSALGAGMNDSVFALTVFDNGSGGGPALYVGGRFTTAGGVAANRIAKWNGSSWSALGSGLIGYTGAKVLALTVFDDGGGPALYAGGEFVLALNTVGTVGVKNIAKWNGAWWSALGTSIPGTDGPISALTVFDDGSGVGPALFAGGQFHSAGGVQSLFLARWTGCPVAQAPCLGDADGDRVVTFADITSTLSNFGSAVPAYGPGDANGDAAVNFSDITTILAAFGSTCP